MITADLILARFPATSKKQVFQAMAERATGLFKGNAGDLLTALLDRERIGPTGIGDGVAIPHVKISGIDKMYGILAQLDTPVEYESFDEKPVDIIYMLIAPEDSKTTEHLKKLAHISRFLKDAKSCAALRSAGGEERITSVLTAWEKQQAA